MCAEISGLKHRPDASGLKLFFESMMTMFAERVEKILQEAVGTARKSTASNSVSRWILSLYNVHPGDIGVLAPLYLNLICLSPEEAMFLPAGQLHAYLEGIGMELMANSDNVLRGGLTTKHVDVTELMKTLRFEGKDIPILSAGERETAEKIFASRAEEFVLSFLPVKQGSPFTGREVRGPEILICTNGEACLTERGSNSPLAVKKGESVIIPATVEGYALEGYATVFKAAVNI
jgi:mannose-6-phosphate isomerase